MYYKNQSMSIKSFFAKIFANVVVMQQQKWMIKPVVTQVNLFHSLIQQAKKNPVW